MIVTRCHEIAHERHGIARVILSLVLHVSSDFIMETDSIDANIFDTMDLSESALAAFNISDISLDESLLYTTPDDSIESSFSSFCSDDQPSPSTPEIGRAHV